jgi:formamidopyrimidine-DNA glycosylase
MPELPEVETVRRGLAKLIVGKKVKDVKHDWPKSYPNSPTDTIKFVMGRKIRGVHRRAKVLLIELDSDYTLVTHLKMTGQLVFVKTKTRVDSHKSLVVSKKTKNERLTTNHFHESERFDGGHPNDSLIAKLPDKSTRVTIDFDDGSALYFNDQRKFGWMRLIPTMQVPEIDFFMKVGPEPLDSDFTAEKFIDRLMRRKNSSIKAVLLDQTVLAGVGNIYADESLYMAKIHPETTVEKIPMRKLATLHHDLIEVLLLSIEKGGSTDRNYVNAEGKKGSYIDFAQVFRREGQPCQRCGADIIKIRVAGRGTHICPRCQKKPKL